MIITSTALNFIQREMASFSNPAIGISITPRSTCCGPKDNYIILIFDEVMFIRNKQYQKYESNVFDENNKEIEKDYLFPIYVDKAYLGAIAFGTIHVIGKGNSQKLLFIAELDDIIKKV